MQPQLDYPGMPRYTEALAGWLAAALAGAPLDLRAQTTGWDAGGWAALRWAIQVHGAAPLLHRALAPAAAALPPGLRAYLAEQHQLSGQRVALLLGELGALLDACRAAEVEVLALKGSLLATGYYAEPGLRPMSDLDLLVRPADEARLLAVLAGLGYQPRERHWKHLTLALPAGSGPVVYWHGDHPDNPRSLDLHTRLHERFLSLAYDLTDDAWAGSAPSLLLGRPARVLAPATLLHHLAIHATSDITDRRLRLLHLHDIALVARALSHADWQALVAGARRRRGERMIYPALLLAARYFTAVPPAVLAALRGGVPPALLQFLDASGAYECSFCNPAPLRIADHMRWFRPGWEQAAALRHQLIPDPGELAARFPQLARPGLLPLAYVRYGTEVGRWALRRVLGRPRNKLAHMRLGAAQQGHTAPERVLSAD